MEERNLKIVMNKAGGNASKGSYGYKISIPPSWAKQMGVTLEERTMKVSFDGEKIIIEKPWLSVTNSI